MALPEAQRFRNNQKKFVLRQAMSHYLPESVLRRNDKAEFSQVFMKAFQTQDVKSLFDSLTIADMGWVNGNEIRRAYPRLDELDTENNDQYYRDISYLWHVFGIELWYNHVFKNRSVSLVKEFD